MKLRLPLVLRASLLACLANVSFVTVAYAAVPPVNPGSIVFCGDSITQGTGASPVYRYQVFKNFVDNGETYTPVGSWSSKGQGSSLQDGLEKIGSDFYYRGQKFDATSEGYSGWWASDLSGMGTEGGASAGANHATIENWTGQSDVMYGGKPYTGSTYNPESVFILAGTNDILHKTNTTAPSTETVVARILACADQYKAANPESVIYVGAILPQEANGLSGWNPEQFNKRTREINKELERLASAKGYIFVQTDKGIRGETDQVISSGKVFTSDNLHPGDQGELIMAGNIARAMGIGQRNGGMNRRSSASLASHLNMSSVPVVVGAAWKNAAHGSGFIIQSRGNSYMEQSWTGSNLSNGFTCEFSLQMFNSAGSTFSFKLGDGTQGGQLNIKDNFVSWGSSILYAGLNTAHVNDFRIAYNTGTTGTKAGYYIWRNGVLIGEALSSSAGNLLGFQAGALSNGSINAGLFDLSWDTSGAFAPDYSSLASGNKDVKGTEQLGGFNVMETPVEDLKVEWPSGAPSDISATTIENVKTAINALTGVRNARITSTFTGATVQGNNLVSGNGETYIELTGQWVNTNTDKSKYLNLSSTGNRTGNLYFKVGGAGSIITTGKTAFDGALLGMNNCITTGNLYMEFSSNTLAIRGEVLIADVAAAVVGVWGTQNLDGSVTLLFNDGTFGFDGNAVEKTGMQGAIIAGGMNNAASSGTVTRSTNIGISGGTFHGAIFAGGQVGNVATTTLGDRTNIQITGGTLNGNIYGGSMTTGNVGSLTVANGTMIRIDGALAATQTLKINGSIFGGSRQSGMVFGDSDIVLSNFTDATLTSTFSAATQFNGCAEGLGKVNGSRNITFSAVEGTLANTLSNFDKLTVRGNSKLKLTNTSSGKISSVSIDAGSELEAGSNLLDGANLSLSGKITLNEAGKYALYLKSMEASTGSIIATAAGVDCTLHLGTTNSPAEKISLHSLNLGAGNNSLVFDLGSHAAYSSLSVDTLASSGVIKLLSARPGEVLGTGEYTLISGDLSGVHSFDLSDFIVGGRQTISWNKDSYKTDNKLILTLEGDVKELVWDGGPAGVWSNSQEDTPWKDADGNRDYFIYLDSVSFTSGGIINIVEEVGPSKVNVSGGVGTVLQFDGNGFISGSASLTKQGEGTLIIKTANTYSGGSHLVDGVLELGNASALGTGKLTVDKGSLVLNTEGGATYSNDIVLNGSKGETLVFSKTASTLAGAISGTGGFTLKEGTLSLSGTWTSTGEIAVDGGAVLKLEGIDISSGSLSLANNSALELNKANTLGAFAVATNTSVSIKGDGINTSTTGTLTVGAGATLTLNNARMSGGMSLGDNVVLNIIGENNRTGNITLGANSTLTAKGGGILGASISGFSGILKLGEGGIGLSSITVTGTTGQILSSSMNQGTLTLSDKIEISGKVSLTLGSADSGPLVINGAIRIAGDNAATLNVLTDTVLTNLNSGGYEYNVNVAQGKTLTAKEKKEGTSTARLRKQGAGTLVIEKWSASYNSIEILAGTFEFANKDAIPYNSIISGDGTLAKSGEGRLTLSGANTFKGGLDLKSGILCSAGANNLGNILNVKGTSTLEIGTGSTTGGLSLSTLRVDTDKTLYMKMDINGANNDKLTFGQNGSLVLDGNILINLDLAAFTEGISYTLIDATATGFSTSGLGTVKINTHYLKRGFTFNQGWNNNLYTVSISGSAASGNLTWAGTGSNNVWETGTASWSGGTGGDNSFYTGDEVTFDNAATNKTVEIRGQVDPSGVITVNNSGAGNDYVFSGSGSIVGTSSLMKTGSGSLTINTSNSFTGGTTITDGSLILNHASALGSGVLNLNGGKLIIANGITLANNIQIAAASSVSIAGGAISGTVTMGNNVNLAIGDGGLTLSKAMGLTAGSTLRSDSTAERYINGDVTITATIPNLGSASEQNNGDLRLKSLTIQSDGGGVNIHSNVIVDTLMSGGYERKVNVIGEGVTFTIRDHTGNNSGDIRKMGAGKMLIEKWTGPQAKIIIDAGSLEYSNKDALEYSKEISGDGRLIKSGEGNLTLKATNTFKGGIVQNGGTLTAGTDKSFGDGGIVVNDGTLDFGSFAMANNIEMNGGNLSRADKITGTIKVSQKDAAKAGSISLGGASGSRLSSMSGVAGINGADTATKIVDIGDGSISLTGGASFGISSDMIGGMGNSASGQVFNFTNAGNSLTLGGTVNLSFTDDAATRLIEDLAAGAQDLTIKLVNGSLTLNSGSSIIFQSPYNIFDAIVSITTGNGAGGSLVVKAKDPAKSGWIVVSGSQNEAINESNRGILDKALGVFNNGRIYINLSGAADINLHNLEGSSSSAVVDTGTNTELVVTLDNGSGSHTKSLYQGSITGSAQLVKGGDDYEMTVGGNVRAQSLLVDGGSMTINGALTTLGSTTVNESSNLILNGKGSDIQGGLILEEKGKLTLGNEATLTVSSLVSAGDADSDADIYLNANSLLTVTSDLELLSDIAGKGVFMVKDAKLTWGASGSVSDDTTVQLGGTAVMELSGDVSMGGISGDGTIQFESHSISLGNANAEFKGTLSGAGTLDHAGTGIQILDTNGGADISLVQSGEGELILRNGKGGAITYDDIDVSSGIVRVEHETSVNSLSIGNSGKISIARSGEQASTFALSNSKGLSSGSSTLTGGGGMIFTGVNESNANEVSFKAGNITFTGDGTFGFTLETTGQWTEFEYTIALMEGVGIDLDNYAAILSGSLKNLGYEIDGLVTVDDVLKLKVRNSGRNGFLAYGGTYNTDAAAEGLWNARFAKPAEDGVLTSIINALRDAGNQNSEGSLTKQQAHAALASYSGSSLTSLLASQRDDLRQQVRWIRNRTTQMGVNQDMVNESMPYFNAWMQGNAGYNDVKQNGDEAGYSLDTWGGTVGFDVDINQNWTVGAAFTANYNKLKTKAFDAANGDNDGYYANIFARIQSGKWAHTLIVTGGVNDVNLKRNVQIGADSYSARTDTSGTSLGAYYEGTYDIALNNKSTSIFQPLFNASIYNSSIDSFTESGMGDASLRADDMKATYGSIGLGARLMGIVGDNVFGRGCLGELRAQVIQDYGDKVNSIKLAPIGAPGGIMKIRGAKVGTTGVQLGAGLSIPVGQQGAIYVDADTEFRSNATVVSGNIGYRYNF